ncbi:esterase/lipase family protein [Sorangium sp. So ce1151]|uniref:esterase/lipase family protein n=1 Tax=Sorangium sp. So ce1151 TaxID=3133332 RepID=UPI003F63E2AC
MVKWLRAAAFAATGREVASFARQAVLLPYDTLAPVIPAGTRDGDDVAIILHGLFASAGVLRPLRTAIERHAAASRAPRTPGRPGAVRAEPSAGSVHTATMSYAPGPGVEALSERLAAIVSALPDGVRLHLVGHSMGGVVCRFFAQEVSDPRIVQTISMASPFGGIPRAGLLGFGGARDLDVSSPILRRVLLGTARSSIPHLSIVAGADTLVRSPIAHALPGGEVRVMEARGHNTLLFDPEVATLVARRIVERRGGAR